MGGGARNGSASVRAAVHRRAGGVFARLAGKGPGPGRVSGGGPRHASAPLQLAGSPRSISVGKGETSRGIRQDFGRSHAVVKKTPPPSILRLLLPPCTCSTSSYRRLAGVEPLLRVSGRRFIVRLGDGVLTMTSTYNLDFHPLAESRLMTSGDTM